MDENNEEGHMVREIVKDEAFLGQKCEMATKDDIAVAIDLLDTLNGILI